MWNSPERFAEHVAIRFWIKVNHRTLTETLATINLQSEVITRL